MAERKSDCGDAREFQHIPKTSDFSEDLAKATLAHSEAVRQNLSAIRR